MQRAKLMVIGFLMVSNVLLTSGCARLNSIYRDFDISEGKGALIDIKQRAIVVSNKEASDGSTIPIVCAEPSPDALSVLASSLSGSVKVKEINVEISNKSQESGSFVGFRTQTIQLLRDFLYRDCEAYMNGVIDKYQYDLLMRRNQKYMVALLGVEQLTGATQAKASSVTSNSPSGSGEGNGGGNQGDSPAAATPPAAANAAPPATAKALSKDVKDKAAKKEGGKDPAGDKTLATEQPDEPKPVKNPEETAGAKADGGVSVAVRDIVTQILQTDDIGQTCFAYIAGDKAPNPELAKICKTYLDEVSKKQAVLRYGCLGIMVDLLSKNPQGTPVDINAVKSLMDSMEKSSLCKTGLAPPAMQLN